MELVKYPDPILMSPCENVAEFGDETSGIADAMLELMYEFKGLGLAGPQAGLSKKIVVINPSGKQEDEIVLLNPEIVNFFGECKFQEGCLSFPGIYAKITRPDKVDCVAQMLDGREVSFSCEGLLARIVQHELDHLNGVLLYDRMGPLGRKAHQRELRRLRKEYRGG